VVKIRFCYWKCFWIWKHGWFSIF